MSAVAGKCAGEKGRQFLGRQKGRAPPDKVVWETQGERSSFTIVAGNPIAVGDQSLQQSGRTAIRLAQVSLSLVVCKASM